MKNLKTDLLLLLVVWCVVGLTNGWPQGWGKKGDRKKTTRVNQIRDKLTSNRLTSGLSFPEVLDFDFFLDGEAPVRSRSRKVSKLRSMLSFDSAGKEHKRDRKKDQFYVGDDGSYQLSEKTLSNGFIDTDLKAIYRNGHGEKCFYARGESHCWRIDGEGRFETVSLENDTIKVPLPNTKGSRKRRQLVYTDFNPTRDRILRIAYVVDKAFMDWFRDLSGDDNTAIEDAEDYIYMLNNEVTYLYRGIKEVSERNASIPDMDITVYAQGFYYPTLGTEWTWLTPYVDGNRLIEDGMMARFGDWVGQGNVGGLDTFDTATFITPRLLLLPDGGNILGIAFGSTVCNRFLRNRRVSLNEDRFFDVALTLVHEVGHSLGSRHDDAGGCRPGTYIMSPYAFGISSVTEDTWNRWSSCSVDEIVAHVRRFSVCLLDWDVSDDDFYDQLCRGVRGTSTKFDIDYQCKTASKVQSSTACSPSGIATSGLVPARACWDDQQVGCTNGAGTCANNVFTIYDGTPCNGGDSNKDYVCFRGDCLEKVNVCAGRSTSATSAPTSAPTAATTAAPTDATTDAPTVAPTEAPSPPCSCSGIWVFFRYGCCRSDTNQDGSCCTGCRPSSRGCTPNWSVGK